MADNNDIWQIVNRPNQVPGGLGNYDNYQLARAQVRRDLIERGAEVVDALIEGLATDPTPDRVSDVAQALGAIGDPRAIEALRGQLDRMAARDEKAYIAVRDALVQLGDRGEFAALVDKVKNNDKNAAISLVKQGDPALDAVLECLQSPEVRESTRWTMVMYIGTQRMTSPELLAYLLGQDYDILDLRTAGYLFVALVAHLEHADFPPLVDRIKTLLTDEKPGVHKNLFGLLSFGLYRLGEIPQKHLIPYMVELLADPTFYAHALKILAEWQRANAVKFADIQSNLLTALDLYLADNPTDANHPAHAAFYSLAERLEAESVVAMSSLLQRLANESHSESVQTKAREAISTLAG